MKGTPRTTRDQQAAERREQILQGAKELFSQNGYHATSIRAINKHVGITDGLLYHYFPKGKQEILETIFEDAQNARVLKMDQLIASIYSELPLEIALESFLIGMVRTITGDREFIRIMFRDAELILSEQRNFMAELVHQRHRNLTEALEKRAKNGEIHEMNYELAAYQILSIGITMITREAAFINIVALEVEDYIKQMVNFTVLPWKK